MRLEYSELEVEEGLEVDGRLVGQLQAVVEIGNRALKVVEVEGVRVENTEYVV